ncbi:hypothetical protein [Halalkalibacter akibai]|uniref:Uncharacterized protein n=1 Tax=Halalkalibacter akibai (strain ATCC 43226 / DSM 21942 / CIP 109018 / JCM 9157 / 1139) TaxID=1236973 RepID=W4R1T0_HALA3|nr:hypothetical protein [Halalkalibacter akibai]GAE37489.1 hypothetical protein JCM9157_4793 [Halalkalibacter akibai JCM 9157]
MQEFLDRVTGFLPPGTAFIYGAGIVIVILGGQYVTCLLQETLMLPWMKQENQLQRKRLLEEKNNQKS